MRPCACLLKLQGRFSKEHRCYIGVLNRTIAALVCTVVCISLYNIVCMLHDVCKGIFVTSHLCLYGGCPDVDHVDVILRKSLAPYKVIAGV